MKLETYELELLSKNSTALRELADHHDVTETEADAQGYNSQAEHHKARAYELRQEADWIDRAHDECAHDYSGRCNNIDGSEQIFCAKCGRNP